VSDEIERFVTSSAQHGDRRAWGQLFTWHFDAIYRFCLGTRPMHDSKIDKLIEQSLSGPGPREAFRQQILRDSTAVLANRPERGRYWRAIGLVAAGILIAAVSFFWGRASMPRVPINRGAAARQGVETTQTVAVPADLVVWLKAARLFEQLGMEQRVTVAYKHAAKLIPSQMYGLGNRSQTVLATETDSDTELPSEPLSRDRQSILAQSFGG